MRIAMIGGGYVGLVSGACFAEFGSEVTIVETDPGRLAALRAGAMPIYEPGLEHLVAENARAGRLAFTDELPRALDGAEAVFVAVGTPTRRGDGHADLTYVYSAAEQIARSLGGYAVIVTKSTVPVGTGRRIADIVRQTRPDLDFDVASNPEFLREGSAIADFMRPDRVVIGTESERAREVLRRLYRPLYLIEAPIVFTSLETAELTKYAANAFLAMKVTFINEIADLCEKAGADVHDVARGIGLDGRIGRKFLHAGPGFGGSCFPKDTLALTRIAQDLGAPARLVETVVAVNESRKAGMANRVIAACGGSVRGKAIAVLGLTFKPETDDMRDAPAVPVVARLIGDGAHVRAFDPEGMDQAVKVLPPGVQYLSERRGSGDRSRRAGVADRVERVPRPRPRTAGKRDGGPGHRRPAQCVRPDGDAGRRFQLSLHRPAFHTPLRLSVESMSMEDAPRLTVCVCTHNRATSLSACLEGLRRQTVAAAEFEVLVVDSASAPEAAQQAVRLAETASNAAYLRIERPGISLARNLGARCARAAWIAYVDDDAIPEPDWVATILGLVEAPNPPAVIGGRILPLWEAPLPGWWPERLRGSLSIIEHAEPGEYPKRRAAARRRAVRREHGRQCRRPARCGRLSRRNRPLWRRAAVG